MIISIASGKGGTGKTTVAANLANAIQEPATILDCDVEEPNAHLFLHPVLNGSEKVIAPVPEVDLDRCTRCKACMDICRFNAIAVVGRAVVTFPELCHSCGGCTAVCPEDAVTEAERVLGWVEKGMGTSPALTFVRGRLDVGQVMVPPIIRQVRTQAAPSGLTLIDAPPGTSCPVIAAMKDTDFVLLVTEPTPFGLHDLTLAVEAVRLLGIPHGLVINRAGMGDDRVHRYAAAEAIPVLMEIPFDKRIAAAYSRGEMITDCLPEYSEQFRNLLADIRQIVAAAKEAK